MVAAAFIAPASAAGQLPASSVGPPFAAAQTEAVGEVAHPTAAQPVFHRDFGKGGGEFFSESARLAVSTDRLFVATPYPSGRVYSFDADAPGSPLNSQSVSEPQGIAEYRGEVFVVSTSDHSIHVLRSSDLSPLRKISPLLPAAGSEYGKLIEDTLASEMVDLDVAWGEVWVSLRNGGTLVLDPQTGLIRSIHIGDPIVVRPDTNREAGDVGDRALLVGSCLDWPGNYCDPPSDAFYETKVLWYWVWLDDSHDVTGYPLDKGTELAQERTYAWKDVSAVPELNGVVQGASFMTRSVASAATAGTPSCLGSAAGCGPTVTEGVGEGTDSPWGMRWLSVVREREEANPSGPTIKGARIDEFAIVDSGGGIKDFQLRRSWNPRCGDQSYDPCGLLHGGVSSDIATRNRGTRIDWSGPPTQGAWINGSHQIPYTVSDADVYFVNRRGSHYLEPARNFASMEMRVDGALIATSTNPSGAFTVDTEERLQSGAYRFGSGVHTLSLIARLTDGTTVVRTNEQFRIDHDVPRGNIAFPGDVISGVAQLTGNISDDHSGPRDWSLQRSAAGQNQWTDVCSVAEPGPYHCSWDTRQVADGAYTLRAFLRDRVMQSRGANTALTSEVNVTVDNTAPSLTVSGFVREAGDDKTPLDDVNTYPIHVEARDNPGSGVRNLDVLVDGVRVDGASQGCAAGGCQLDANFTFRPADYSDGLHTITVRATDGAGHTADTSWQVDVERLIPGGDQEDLDDAADGGNPSGGTAAQGAAASNQSAITINGVTMSAASDPLSDASGLLPCTGPGSAANFDTYSLGSSFEGMSVEAILRRCAVPEPTEPVRANYVSYIYGSCEPDPAELEGSCHPPIEVQSWPACERSLADLTWAGEPLPHEPTQVRGVTAAIFPDFARLEVYTGDATVALFGDDMAQLRRAAEALVRHPRNLPPSLPPGAPAPSEGELPATASGAINGTLDCASAPAPNAPAAVPMVNLLGLEAR